MRKLLGMGAVLLRKYLNEHNETQSAFALRAGVSGGALSSWLASTTGPDITSALAIETATAGAVPIASWARADGRRHEPKPVRRTTQQASKKTG